MIPSKDISVIVQGAINQYTKQSLLSIRKFLPEAEIILSTWEGSDVGGLDYDILLLNQDPGAEIFTKSGTKHNINRQILSTQNGLKKTTRKYSLKLRSDSVLLGNKFLKYFDKYNVRAKKCKILEKRVLVLNWSTRLPKVSPTLLFHPSDFFAFGLTSDLLNIWDIPLAKEPEFSSYFKNNTAKNPEFLVRSLCKFPSEMYIWLAFLEKNGVNVNIQDYTDCLDEDLINLSELTIVNNLCVLDYKSQFDVLCKKYVHPHYPTMPVYHFVDWVKNYEKYCGVRVKKNFEYYLSGVYAFCHGIACFIQRNKKKIIRFKFGKKEKYFMLFGVYLFKK